MWNWFQIVVAGALVVGAIIIFAAIAESCQQACQEKCPPGFRGAYVDGAFGGVECICTPRKP